MEVFSTVPASSGAVRAVQEARESVLGQRHRINRAECGPLEGQQWDLLGVIQPVQEVVQAIVRDVTTGPGRSSARICWRQRLHTTIVEGCDESHESEFVTESIPRKSLIPSPLIQTCPTNTAKGYPAWNVQPPQTPLFDLLGTLLSHGVTNDNATDRPIFLRRAERAQTSSAISPGTSAAHKCSAASVASCEPTCGTFGRCTEVARVLSRSKCQV